MLEKPRFFLVFLIIVILFILTGRVDGDIVSLKPFSREVHQ